MPSKLTLVTIQRNRGKWLAEWIAYHWLFGVDKFVIYLHKTQDNSSEIVNKASKYIDIDCFSIDENTVRPQLAAYQHAYQFIGGNSEWVGFIDGDEFLFTPGGGSVPSVIESLSPDKQDSIGVWWLCFGSNGHLEDPNGLVIEDYVRRAPKNWVENRHFKSIVRGGLGDGFSVLNNAHYFKTLGEIRDESGRILGHGKMPNLMPSHKKIAIAHFATQSRNFYETFKKTSGAADAGAALIREEEWWRLYDRNEVIDTRLQQLAPMVRERLRSLDMPWF